MGVQISNSTFYSSKNVRIGFRIIIFSTFGVSKYTKDVIDLDRGRPSGEIQTMLLFDEGALIWRLLEIKFLNSRKSRRLILSNLLWHTLDWWLHLTVCCSNFGGTRRVTWVEGANDQRESRYTIDWNSHLFILWVFWQMNLNICAMYVLKNFFWWCTWLYVGCNGLWIGTCSNRISESFH